MENMNDRFSNPNDNLQNNSRSRQDDFLDEKYNIDPNQEPNEFDVNSTYAIYAAGEDEDDDELVEDVDDDNDEDDEEAEDWGIVDPQGGTRDPDMDPTAPGSAV